MRALATDLIDIELDQKQSCPIEIAYPHQIWHSLILLAALMPCFDADMDLVPVLNTFF